MFALDYVTSFAVIYVTGLWTEIYWEELHEKYKVLFDIFLRRGLVKGKAYYPLLWTESSIL